MNENIGHVIAKTRRQRGLSQRDLARIVGRSESWVSQVERGIQPVHRLPVLKNLAHALSVNIDELQPLALSNKEEEVLANTIPNDLDEIRILLSGHPCLSTIFTKKSEQESLDTSELERTVEQAWTLGHRHQLAELSSILTTLIPKLEIKARTSTSPEQSTIWMLLSRTYQVTSAAFVRQDEPDAAWLAADRAIHAAERSGDPLEVAAGHFRLVHAFMRLKRWEQAEQVTSTVLKVLEAVATGTKTENPQLISIMGALNLAQAINHARADNRSQARQSLDRATYLADKLGEDRNDFNTEFGPTNVLLHRVAVAVDMGDAGEALELASTVNPTQLSYERRSRFLLDVTRAHLQRRQFLQATTVLLEADALAPEYVRTHRHGRSAIRELLQYSPHPPEPGLVALAENAGIR